MKVAVFGGSGFVGEYIINELLNNNFKPYVLLRYGSQSKVTRNKERLLTVSFATGIVFVVMLDMWLTSIGY